MHADKEIRSTIQSILDFIVMYRCGFDFCTTPSATFLVTLENLSPDQSLASGMLLVALSDNLVGQRVGVATCPGALPLVPPALTPPAVYDAGFAHLFLLAVHSPIDHLRTP